MQKHRARRQSPDSHGSAEATILVAVVRRKRERGEVKCGTARARWFRSVVSVAAPDTILATSQQQPLDGAPSLPLPTHPHASSPPPPEHSPVRSHKDTEHGRRAALWLYAHAQGTSPLQQTALAAQCPRLLTKVPSARMLRWSWKVRRRPPGMSLAVSLLPASPHPALLALAPPNHTRHGSTPCPPNHVDIQATAWITADPYRQTQS